MYLDTSSSGLFAEPSGYINFLEINMTIIYSKKKKVIWKTGNMEDRKPKCSIWISKLCLVK